MFFYVLFLLGRDTNYSTIYRENVILMKTYEDYLFTDKEFERIQKTIIKGKIEKYIKKYGHEPSGDLSEFYMITDADLEPHRIQYFCKRFFGQNEKDLKNYCFVDKSVTNAVIDSDNVTVRKGKGYHASILPLSGYEVLRENVLIKMGGEDITDTAFKKHSVDITSVTGNVSISIIATVKTDCSVDYFISNGTHSGSVESVKRGADFTTTLTPNEGYELKSISVYMGGINITSSAFNNGVVYINSVAGDISISAEYGLISYTITVNGRCAVGKLLSGSTTKVFYGDSFDGEIITPEHYDFLSATVTMGGIDVTNNVFSNGRVTIDRIVGNVVITTDSELHWYDVEYEYTYFDESGETRTTTNFGRVQYGKTLTKTIDVEPGYGLYKCECVVGENDEKRKFYPDGIINISNIEGPVHVSVLEKYIPDNEFLYINVDNAIEIHFDAISGIVVSNTIENGIGLVVCSEPLTGTSGLFTSQARVSTVFLPNSIGNNVDFRGSMVSTVYLPGTITEIPASAFTGCSNLKKIYGMKNVVSIGENAFSNTYMLSFSSPKLETISSMAFAGTGIVTIHDAYSLKSIGYSAFMNSKGVIITNMNRLSMIDSSAFSLGSTGNYVNLTFGDEMQNSIVIGPNAFNRCSIRNFDFSKVKLMTPRSFYNINVGHLDLSNCTISDCSDVICGLTGTYKITIGENITNINGMLNSSGLTNLSDIYCYSMSSPTVGEVHDVVRRRTGKLHVRENADCSEFLSALGVNWKKAEDITV